MSQSASESGLAAGLATAPMLAALLARAKGVVNWAAAGDAVQTASARSVAAQTIECDAEDMRMTENPSGFEMECGDTVE